MNESEVDQLRRFVRHTLGCGCPEEVLRRIDRAPDLELSVEQGIAPGRGPWRSI